MLLTYLEYDTPGTNPVHRNTLNPHPHNLGYVQGMSDLLSPIYAVLQDDALAFWAFAGFMQRMSRNFVRDQSGMRAQLSTLDQLVQILDPQLYKHLQACESTNFFFMFRMLLVWYKREFEWPDVLRLWEVLWTDHLSSQFHLFVAVAVLEKHRDVIIQHLRGFDEVLKFVNDLSGRIDLKDNLVRSEALFRKFTKIVEAIDRKEHFPEPGAEVRRRRLGGLKDTQTVEERRARAASASASASATASSSVTGGGTPGEGTHVGGDADDGDDAATVISPELRALLSREIIVLDDDDVGDTADSMAAIGHAVARPSGLVD